MMLKRSFIILSLLFFSLFINCYMISDHNESSSSNTSILGIMMYQNPININAPENINASDGTYIDKIVITWNSVDRAQHYIVYRANLLTRHIQ